VVINKPDNPRTGKEGGFCWWAPKGKPEAKPRAGFEFRELLGIFYPLKGDKPLEDLGPWFVYHLLLKTLANPAILEARGHWAVVQPCLRHGKMPEAGGIDKIAPRCHHQNTTSTLLLGLVQSGAFRRNPSGFSTPYLLWSKKPPRGCSEAASHRGYPPLRPEGAYFTEREASEGSRGLLERF
jgi:hypothetical protein